MCVATVRVLLEDLVACHRVHMRLASQRTQGQCLRTHTHVFSEARNPWSSFRLPDCACCFCCNVRVCDLTQMCVAGARGRVRCRREHCCDLAACRFFAQTHIHTRTHARICGVSREATPGSVSAHTCVLQKQGIRGHASSFLDCVLIAHTRSRP